MMCHKKKKLKRIILKTSVTIFSDNQLFERSFFSHYVFSDTICDETWNNIFSSKRRRLRKKIDKNFSQTKIFWKSHRCFETLRWIFSLIVAPSIGINKQTSLEVFFQTRTGSQIKVVGKKNKPDLLFLKKSLKSSKNVMERKTCNRVTKIRRNQLRMFL